MPLTIQRDDSDEQRREPRVRYRTTAHLLSEEGETVGEEMDAEVHNLSISGMLVTADRIPEIGARLHCRVFLGADPWVLRGKIAWVRPDAVAAQAAGIEFIDLTRDDFDALDRALGKVQEVPEATLENVLVRFESLPEPVRARAHLGTNGVVLSTKLPFARIGSIAEIRYERDGCWYEHTGRIDSVALAPSGDDGVARLLVEVGPALLPGEWPSIDVRDASVILAPLVEQVTEPVRSRWFRWAAIPITGVVVTTCLFVALRSRSIPDSDRPPTVPRSIDQPRPRVESLNDGTMPIASAVTEPSPIRPQQGTAASSRISHKSFEIEIGERVTRVRVPIEGSVEGAHAYALTVPVGFVAVVPHGRMDPQLLGHFTIGAGGIRRVWIDSPSEGGLRLRVLTDDHVNAPRAVFEPKAIRFDFDRAP